MAAYDILIIGCGNIGAMYDWDSAGVLTHAKAFAEYDNAQLSFFDTDTASAIKVAERYSGKVILEIDEDLLSRYDIVSICSPTATHYKFLQQALNAKTPLIICEKPVTDDSGKIDDLLDQYESAKSKVLVNYIRRFLPAFAELKNIIASILKKGEKPVAVNIRYQRGFVNNCSHALDLLSYLFDKPVSLGEKNIMNCEADHFEKDPTLSLTALWGSMPLFILGLAHTRYSLFEIDIFFTDHKITIREAGDVCDVYRSQPAGRFLKPLVRVSDLSYTGCLENHMRFVVKAAFDMLNNDRHDNFKAACDLNRTMLQVLNN